MNINPLVSIIVPVYKVENELSRCIESLLNQTYSNLEIILVDDGSPDACPAICDEYAKKDNRVLVIHKENGGLSDARNAGLKEAHGEWLMFVDSDDYIETDAVEQFISSLSLQNFDSNIDIVVGVAREISLNGKISYQRHTNLEANGVYDSKEYIIRSIKRKELFAPAWLNLYRTAFWLKFKHSFKVGIYYEDLDIALKVFLSANKVLYTDYPFYNYIKRDGSITISGNSAKSLTSAKIVLSDIFETVTAVKNVKFRKVLYRYFSNVYLAIIGNLRLQEQCYPSGCNCFFLLRNAFDFKDFLKAVVFGFSQKWYVKLYAM